MAAVAAFVQLGLGTAAAAASSSAAAPRTGGCSSGEELHPSHAALHLGDARFKCAELLVNEAFCGKSRANGQLSAALLNKSTKSDKEGVGERDASELRART